jgi:hypothetical protein
MFKSLEIPLPTGLNTGKTTGKHLKMENVTWKSDMAWVTNITLEEHVVHSHA